MANENVYVGEIGAKELYRRVKSLINNADGDGIDITDGKISVKNGSPHTVGKLQKKTDLVQTHSESPANRLFFLIRMALLTILVPIPVPISWPRPLLLVLDNVRSRDHSLVLLDPFVGEEVVTFQSVHQRKHFPEAADIQSQYDA